MVSLPVNAPAFELLAGQLAGGPLINDLCVNAMTNAPTPTTVAGPVNALGAQGIEFPDDVNSFRLSSAHRDWAVEEFFLAFAGVRSRRGRGQTQATNFVNHTVAPEFEREFMLGVPQDRLDDYRPHIQKVSVSHSLEAERG